MGLIFSIGFWNCSDIVVFLFFVSFHSFILVQCCLYVWIFVLCLVHSVVCMSGFSFCVLYTVLPVCLDFRSVSFTQCCLYVWIFVLCLVHSVVCMSGFSFCLVHSVACMYWFSFCVFYTVLPVCLDFRSVSCTQCCLYVCFIRSVSGTQCCLYVCFIRSVSCTVLPVCLDCPYLIAPLFFSNVYLHFVNRGPFWETTKFVSICFCHCGKDMIRA